MDVVLLLWMLLLLLLLTWMLSGDGRQWEDGPAAGRRERSYFDLA